VTAETTPKAEWMIAAAPRFEVNLTAAESRLRASGTEGVFDPLIGRVMREAYYLGASAAFDRCATRLRFLSCQMDDQNLAIVTSVVRQVVEGLAKGGNPAATVAILEAERRAQADLYQAEAERLKSETERLRSDLNAALSDGGRLRAELAVAVARADDTPPAPPVIHVQNDIHLPKSQAKDIRVSFDHDPKGAVTSATGTVIPAGVP